jgi:hypothetical protein
MDTVPAEIMNEAIEDGDWLELEPITPELESDLRDSGLESAEIAELKDKGIVYCRSGRFFFPPVDNFSPLCGSRCLQGQEDFVESPQCQSCLIQISSKGFVSAVRMNPDGTYKAVKYCRITPVS